MKMKLDDNGALSEIMSEITNIQIIADKQAKAALTEIGKVVQASVTFTAPKSDADSYYYEGDKLNNTHIADDVVYKIKNKKGWPYVSISGGKKTWRKWHLASDGHVALNGRFIPGNHFVDKAMNNCEAKVDNVIDAYAKDVIG